MLRDKRHVSFNVIYSVLFVCVVILIGALMVRLTTLKKTQKACSYVFHPFPSHLEHLDSHPQSIVVDDLNHDHYLDLILIHSNTHTLAIYCGRGDGTFDAPLLYFIGPQARPVSLAVGRLNNDDHPDIVVAAAGTHSISVMFGLGNGIVTTPINYSTSQSRPRQVSLADMNGDKRLDILVLSEETNEVVLFVNRGNGSFLYSNSYSTGPDSSPCFMAIADANEDGAPDMIVANNGTGDLNIFFGSGNRTIMVDQQVLSLGIGASACAVVIDDINLDDHVDLIVTKSGNREIVILHGYGNGSFRSEVMISTNQGKPLAVGVIDFNHDGQKDLLVIYADENRLEMFLGQKNGSFISDASYTSASLSSSPSSFSLADVNNDSRTDMIVTYIDTNSVAVFLGFNQASFHAQTLSNFPYTAPMTTVSAMDFNGDNHTDLVGWFNDTTFFVLIGDGTGHFQTPIYHLVQHNVFWKYLFTDVNNEGGMDLIMCGMDCSSINVYLQKADRTFAPPLVSSINYNHSPPSNMVLIDANSDSIPDILLYSQSFLDMSVFLGYGNGTFHQSGISSITPSMIHEPYDQGDVNEDGHIDIVCNLPGKGFYSFFGLGNGSFVNVRNYTSTIGFTLAQIVLRDLNNDRHLDLITIDHSSSNMSVRLGDGQGGFDSERIYSVDPENSFEYLFVGDFNGDSNIDVAIIYPNVGSTHIYVGHGDGSLILATTLSLARSLDSWVIDDFNEDGRLDWWILSAGVGTILFGYDAGALINPTTYGTGSELQSSLVLTNDFNHDGHWDLALLNTGQESITVRFGRGDGTFDDGMTYPTGDRSMPQTMIMDDFDGDQIRDLVVVNAGTDSILLFTGLINGSFLLKMTLSTGSGSRPSSIIAAHLNDDERLDMVVTNDNLNTLSLFIHSQYPRLVGQLSSPTGIHTIPTDVVMADFNGDQYMDIVVVLTDPATVGILLGDGTGNFADQLTLAITNGTSSPLLLVARIDENNQTDLLYGTINASTIVIFMNFDQSSWSEVITYNLDPSAAVSNLAVADVNNDGYSDLIILVDDNKEVRVVLNQRNKTFASPLILFPDKICQPSSVRSGYFNHDDYLDLIFIASDQHTLCIYLGKGNGTFDLSRTFSVAENIDLKLILCTDVNNDRLTDLVLAYPASGTIHVLLSQNESTIPMKTIISSSPLLFSLSRINTADFNQDGLVDLIAICMIDDGILVIIQGRGDGTFAREAQYPIDKNAGGYEIVVGDLNQDGISDVVLSLLRRDRIVPYLIFCCDPFTDASSLPNQLNTTANFIATGDFNRDNRSDLIISYAGTNQLGLYLSYGNDTFNNRTLFSIRSNSRPVFIAVADLNNDDQLDLVVISEGEEMIDTYFGDSSGLTFLFNQSYFIGVRSVPSSLLVVDFNNDTHLDVLIAEDGTNSISILLGNGDGSFRSDWHLNTGYASRPSSVGMGDFDGDSQWDLAVTMPGSNTIGMIWERCDSGI